MTPKRTAFIAEYLICRNASEAARRAGYSAKRADAIGYDLLRNTEIRAAVDTRLQEVAEKAGLSAELVRASLVRELNFDPAKAFNADGSLKQIHEMDPDTRKVLSSVETVQVGSPEAPVFIRKVKWNTPSQAREQAMKHLGMFERDNKQPVDPLQALIKAIQGNGSIGPMA